MISRLTFIHAVQKHGVLHADVDVVVNKLNEVIDAVNMETHNRHAAEFFSENDHRIGFEEPETKFIFLYNSWVKLTNRTDVTFREWKILFDHGILPSQIVNR